jgi:hypothetical protein
MIGLNPLQELLPILPQDLRRLVHPPGALTRGARPGGAGGARRPGPLRPLPRGRPCLHPHEAFDRLTLAPGAWFCIRSPSLVDRVSGRNSNS